MKNVNINLVLAASAVALAVTGVAGAATQGTLGNDSTGTSDVNIIKENMVQITDVDDIDLGTEALLTTNKAGSDGVCVHASGGTYNVTATGTRPLFQLEAIGGATPVLYTVTWTGDLGVSVPVLPGVPSIPFTGDPLQTNCGGATNATFEVSVDAATFNAASPGEYTDTLTLLIAPN